jgi:hypothetical protein
MIGEFGDVEASRLDRLQSQPLSGMHREARMKLDRHQ